MDILNLFNNSSSATFLFEVSGSAADMSVVSFTANEWMSLPYSVSVAFATPYGIESFDDIIGSEALLTIINKDLLAGGEDRYFHGIVRRLERIGSSSNNYCLYEAEIVPAVFQLSLRKNSRIFQNTMTQDIVKQLLEESGITSDRYRFALQNKERLRKFCVQYRETDLDFVTRLLEEEGMFYFFEHYSDKHVLVISDSSVVHVPINGNPSITFNSNGGMVAETESIYGFTSSQRMTSEVFVHRNFNFKNPSVDMTAKASDSQESKREIYEYPALHVTQERGSALARAHREGLKTMQKQGHGQSSSCRLTPGYNFALIGHDSASLNIEYLIVDVSHSGTQPQSLEEMSQGPFSYGNSFTVIPATTPFRPTATRQKPIVKGIQTAIVVGPKGEEIYADEYGRIKVQFHWDREGRRDEKSSCWLRIGQTWSGNGWGMINIPRIGDEVLVDFIDGDPDRPIIVGSVNNAESPALFSLPANKTQSGIRTRSYPNGGRDNYHELRFEDKKGSEEIYLQSEKDWNILVKNDKTQNVEHDEALHVANNRLKTVGVDQMVQVGANHTEIIGANKSISVGSNKTETVGLNSAETVGLAKELTIGGLYQVSVGGVMNETVIGAKAEEVGVTKAVLVGAHMTEKVAGNRSLTVGQNLSATVSQNTTVKAKAIVLEADDEIIFKTGSSTISLKSSGEIVVTGATITEKASGEIVIKGARTSVN
ncbi:type VI secretion system Vgr family protein [Geobacter metallireducens RCH3]|uniref:Type VI secretion system needle syringe protein TssI n=2 Tax=Geobacter metallireducens TaxID=28232 RepID=Q39YZ3_GEOMG|nr:type VI secretion system tip protein VgrG [Geobacter metallireducens]ABB30531.1 type VI secretion system needle syringe protein TssI [Geobacter metallireducens GS-15]EHP85205.1 type VI secretion system Vgr family protein [Geobacter metallireducens RCH3]MBT1076840.1 type VI secretion system tip protein VgrG [Geobacter grbiciae]